MDVPEEEEERERELERIFEEIMVENFPNLVKDMNINIQEVQQTPGKMNLKRYTLRQI